MIRTTRIRNARTRPYFLCGFALPLVAALAVATVLSPLFSRPVPAAPSATALVTQMAKAENTLSYTATEEIERPGSAELKMRVWRQGRKQRIEYLAPAVRKGDIVVDDGQKVWIYLRADNMAMQTVSRGRGTDFLLRRLKELNTRIAGVGTVGERMAWIVEIARDGSPNWRLWVDQKNQALLRSERLDKGRRVEGSLLSNITFGAVNPSRFAWTPPADAKVTRTEGSLYTNANGAKRAAAWLRLPARVPAGYAFETAVVDSAKNEAWLRYSSGSNRFSIFQQRGDAADKPAQKVGEAWFLQKAGNRFLIVGLNDAQARELANTL